MWAIRGLGHRVHRAATPTCNALKSRVASIRNHGVSALS